MLARLFLEYEHNLVVVGGFYNSFKYNDYLGGFNDATFEKQERVDQSQFRIQVCKYFGKVKIFLKVFWKFICRE